MSNEKTKKTYTPLEVVQELTKSLKSKLKEKAKAKAILEDIEDNNYVAEIGNSPDTEIHVMDKGAFKLDPTDTATGKSIERNAAKQAKNKNSDKPSWFYKDLNDKAPKTRSLYNKTVKKPNLPKSEDLDKCGDIKKARIDDGKAVMEKVKIRKERASDAGKIDKKRYEKTSERLKQSRDQDKMEKSNYGPKGAELYNQADNAKRKAKNVGEAGYASIKVKAGSNASGGQGKTKLNEDMKKLNAKNKKQPVQSMKDMSPEKQAEMKALYEKTEKTEVKKTEKLKKLLEKIKQKHK